MYPVESTPKRYRDYLDIKPQIEDELLKESQMRAFNAWLAQRKEEANIEVHEDVLWSLIDRSAYSGVTPDEAPVNP